MNQVSAIIVICGLLVGVGCASATGTSSDATTLSSTTAKATVTAAEPKAEPKAKPATPAPKAKPAPKADKKSDPAATEKPVELDMKDVSYAIGMQIGGTMKQQNLQDLDVSELAAGLEAALRGQETRMTDQDVAKIIGEFRKMMSQRMRAMQEAQAKENLKKEVEFLAENAKREGVKTLPSGLQYEVLAAGDGTGAKPTAEDRVKVHYKGTLLDGSEFDSSIKRGKPAEFRVGGVIPGWTEALQLMSVGDKWKLYIPAKLAYGSRGNRRIPANSTLIFEVELLEVMPKPELKAPTTKPAPKAAPKTPTTQPAK